MPIRDLSLICFVVALLPVCVARPFVGVLAWAWISFMNPHRLAWGAAWNFPFALLVGSATLAGFVLTGEPKRVPRTVGTALIVALWLWMTVSTVFAHNPQGAHAAWAIRSKMFLMLFVSLALVRDRERLKVLTLVVALSIGFYGLKGGLFVLATGGRYHVEGPDISMLAGENHLGVALSMTLPLLYYLRREARQRTLQHLLLITFALSIPAVVGTYSRGALLSLGSVLVMLAVKSRQKVIAGLLCATCALGAVYLLPQEWTSRMDTIATYQTDSSATRRIDAWILAWRLGLARPILGWGPEAMEDEKLYDRFYPDSPSRADVHSAYFQILSEGGFVTLGIWLGLIVWALVRLRWLETAFRGGEYGWIANYASMFQVGLVGYMIGAAFLEQGFFDLLYYFVGLTVVLVELVRKQVDTVRVPAIPLPKSVACRLSDGRQPGVSDAGVAPPHPLYVPVR